ncbi:hypothetical protein B0H14DRAFT_3432732 [Mycena olivaceomarginata]|nr:hypothetical protein B0H14DRAFT_3432732 [Mycena olivaceomarginata]
MSCVKLLQKPSAEQRMSLPTSSLECITSGGSHSVGVSSGRKSSWATYLSAQWVHRYFFERESTFFKAQLAIPATPGAPRIGTTDDSAILLDNVRSPDFAKLLWVFYKPKYSLYDATVEDWSTILELSCRWEFAKVKSLAVRWLEKLELPDIDRILLTVEEGIRLGMETFISLSRARECALNQAASGGHSPAPATLGGTELMEIIKDHFNTTIAPLYAHRSRVLHPHPAPPSPSTAKPHATSASSDNDDNEAETIMLVLGAHPVVDARDLVILENVELAAPAPAQDRARQGGSVAPPPKTPRRQSLLRAVLIRTPARRRQPTPGPVILGWSAAPAPAPAPTLSPSPARQGRPPLSPTKDKDAAPAHGDDTDTGVRALGLE